MRFRITAARANHSRRHRHRHAIGIGPRQTPRLDRKPRPALPAQTRRHTKPSCRHPTAACPENSPRPPRATRRPPRRQTATRTLRDPATAPVVSIEVTTTWVKESLPRARPCRAPATRRSRTGKNETQWGSSGATSPTLLLFRSLSTRALWSFIGTKPVPLRSQHLTKSDPVSGARCPA